MRHNLIRYIACFCLFGLFAGSMLFDAPAQENDITQNISRDKKRKTRCKTKKVEVEPKLNQKIQGLHRDRFKQNRKLSQHERQELQQIIKQHSTLKFGDTFDLYETVREYATGKIYSPEKYKNIMQKLQRELEKSPAVKMEPLILKFEYDHTFELTSGTINFENLITRFIYRTLLNSLNNKRFHQKKAFEKESSEKLNDKIIKVNFTLPSNHSSNQQQIQALQDAAREIETSAEKLERLNLFLQADTMRQQAKSLRLEARQRMR